MRVLFIFTNIDTYNKKQYPHGIGALSAVLKKAGHQVDLFYLTGRQKKSKFLKELVAFSFDLIGISTTTNQWPIVKEFPAWIKEKYPAVPIILGGIHPTLVPEEVISTAGVDVVCRGEGELPLLELVEALENSRDYSLIKSLWVKKIVDGQEVIIKNPLMPLVKELDSLPFADRKILDYQNLLFNHSYEESPQEATVMAGRGCPFNCTYCCNNSLKKLYPSAQTYIRKRSVDNVISELKYLQQNYFIKSFYFEDDTFTLDRRWVEEFCQKYQREIGLPFKIYVRPLTFDYELLKKLKEAGLYYVQIGVECGNEEFRQQKLKRNITNEQLVEIFSWFNELKIRSLAFMVIGWPDETKELINESMELVKKLRPYCAQISVYYPYPANELYHYCKKNGLLTTRTKTTFFCGLSTIKLKYLGSKELRQLHSKFWRLSQQLRQTWLKPMTKFRLSRPLSNRRWFSELKLLSYKPYFVLVKLPLFLLRQPYWLFKLKRTYQKEGWYRALQSVYDYHAMINSSEAEEARKKKEKIVFKPLLLNKAKPIQHFAYQPKISIIVPIFCPARDILHETIKSVLMQSYSNWELCLVDGSPRRDRLFKDMLNYYAQKYDNIKVKFLTQNLGIAGNSNEALKMATGDYVGFLDHDDELAPEALEEVVGALNGPAPGAELIYTDEDKINSDGSLSEPFYKPDWSPDYLMSVNYICHLAVVKAGLLQRVRGFDTKAEGAQDYDLFLRLTEQTSNIYHIPKILYHWRKSPSSTAAIIDSKPYVIQAGKKAIQNALSRRGIRGEVIPLGNTGSGRVKYAIYGEPLVSIIIPFRNGIYLVKKCLENILQKTIYRNFEIILVDNQSQESLAEYLLSFGHKYGQAIKLINFDQEFNFSAINNSAVLQASGQYFLFLNNDTEVITPGWLGNMLEHAQRKEIGAVGAKLLYPNGKIQHCGVHLDHQMPEHFYRGLSDEEIIDPGYRSSCVSNVAAVTGACLMVRKEVFEEVGGFDPALPDNYNDIDFCLKIRARGYRIICTPHAELYHYESASRIPLVAPWEKQYMQTKWGRTWRHDPYYRRKNKIN